MPNRMIRDWTASEKIGSISVYAERFFVRLIMKADDYGCFYADTRLLKANLFPLLLDSVREADITRWMAECQKAGLIVIYEHESKSYLQIIDFKQRLDRAKAKFPQANDSLSNATDSMAEKEEEKEKELETEKEGGFVNPFGIGFKAWDGFKNYKKAEFNERYKSKKTEQAALNKLFEMAEGNPEKAVKILEQSIANRWKGFFPLKENYGKQQSNIRDDVQEALNKHLAGVQQARA